MTGPATILVRLTDVESEILQLRHRHERVDAMLEQHTAVIGLAGDIGTHMNEIDGRLDMIERTQTEHGQQLTEHGQQLAAIGTAVQQILALLQQRPPYFAGLTCSFGADPSLPALVRLSRHAP